jgi:undecaprenyl diphosphate synthase
MALDASRLPRHVGIIMDGNGRWAQKRGLARIEGHRAGAESVREIVRACREIGIPVLTLFAFSEQNWKRPEPEVRALWELLVGYLESERAEILDHGIRLTAIGDLGRLPEFVGARLGVLCEESSRGSDMTLCLALSYGGREDLVQAVRRIACDARDDRIDAGALDATTVERYLMTGPLGDLDLLIRTSGEQRLSNFLLWPAAYAELYFTETLWPDFRRPHLIAALEDYQARERRFGRTEADS